MRLFVVGLILLAVLPCAATADSLELLTHRTDAEEWAKKVASGLSLEKKVAQLVFIDVTGGYFPDDDPRLQQWTALVRTGIGGVVFYGGTPRDVAALLNRLQKQAEIPVLMAGDFEGGPGQQVTGATEFPANMALAAIGSEELVYKVAKVGAQEGRAMGVHLAYSPVVDLSTRPDGPAESVRSFGGDVNLLGRLVAAYLRGYMENGMLATAKHFPGRGNVEPWPERPLFSMIKKTAGEMEHEDLAAFKKAIDAGVPVVMTEHIIVPSLTDGSDLTASVERKLATGWLRDKLGFRGLLTTDDLWYEHIVDRYGAVDVGVKAMQAGHDLLLKPKDASAMITRIVAAVRSGELSEAHINQALQKLLYWKARLGLQQNRFVDEAKVSSAVGTSEHWNLAQEVADRSLTLLKNSGVLPLTAEARKNLVHVSVQKTEADPSPAMLAMRMQAAFPGIRNFTLRPEMEASSYDRIFEAAQSADAILLSFFVQRDRLASAVPVRDRDLQLIERISQQKPGRVIAMSYGNPHLIRKLGAVSAFAVGYGERGWFGNQPIYFESFIKLLKGEIQAGGRLPVRISDEYPIGSGIVH